MLKNVQLLKLPIGSKLLTFYILFEITKQSKEVVHLIHLYYQSNT